MGFFPAFMILKGRSVGDSALADQLFFDFAPDALLFVDVPNFGQGREADGVSEAEVGAGGASYNTGKRVFNSCALCCPSENLFPAVHAHAALYALFRVNGWGPVDLFPWVTCQPCHLAPPKEDLESSSTTASPLFVRAFS